MPNPRGKLFQSQLFLDDTWIEDTVKVQRVWHQALKYAEPVLHAEHPWESNCPVAFGTILHREGRFQMWYNVWTRLIKPRVCYAESDDGVHWTKPKLGLCEVLGSTANNVVIQSKNPNGLIDDISIIDDPADHQWPLKALYWDGQPGTTKQRRGIWAAQSADGVQWQDIGKVLPAWGDRFNAMALKYNGKYVLYGRAPLPPSPKGRVVYRTESPDLRHWTKPRLVLAADSEDSPHTQFYSATAFPYAGHLLGSIERMHMSPDKLDPEIIWSHDNGTSWQRSRTRPAFIRLGPQAAFDSEWINLTTNGPIVCNEKLWFYYSGRSGAHGVEYPHNHGAIGLATLRIDGFCSMQAAEMAGSVLTKPMPWPGGELMINADTRRDITAHPSNVACGQVRVEVRDPRNSPVRGYRLEECVPLRNNTWKQPDTCAPIHWSRQRSMQSLKGRRVRLFFELRDAHLYSFKAGK